MHPGIKLLQNGSFPCISERIGVPAHRSDFGVGWGCGRVWGANSGGFGEQSTAQAFSLFFFNFVLPVARENRDATRIHDAVGGCLAAL